MALTARHVPRVLPRVRRFKGALPMPNIGYGSNKKTRHTLPNGFLKYTVNNVKDLELLMMHNRWGAGQCIVNVGHGTGICFEPGAVAGAKRVGRRESTLLLPRCSNAMPVAQNDCLRGRRCCASGAVRAEGMSRSVGGESRRMVRGFNGW